MPSALDAVLAVAAPRLDGRSTPEDAAVVLTSFALVALSDDVSTLSERRAMTELLEASWGIVVDAEATYRALERAADEPRHVLLHALEERWRGWSRERAERLLTDLGRIIDADGHLAAGEEALLRRITFLLGLQDRARDAAEPPRGQVVLSTVALEEGKPVIVGRLLRSEICLPRAPIAPSQLRLTLRSGRLEFETLASTQAVLLGGREVTTGSLGPGEELSIGRYRLRLEPSLRDLAVMRPTFATVLDAENLATVVRQDGRPRTLLEGVTFRARAGEMVAVIGPSGSGKSTLLHLLRGDLRASRGRVSLDSSEVAPGAAAAIRRIAFVPQEELLFPALSVEEAVSYAARLKGIHVKGAPTVARHLVDEMLECVGLASHDVRSTLIGDIVRRGISGGQRRRVSVAQELVGDETDVLLLDEPTSGLDPRSEAGITALMRDLADSGRIVIAATHAVRHEILSSFDSVLCLDAHGRLAYFGPAAGLLGHFHVRSVAEIFDQLEAERGAERAEPAPDGANASAAPSSRPGAPAALSFVDQVAVLLDREARIRARDRVSLLLVIALPLVVSALCSLVYYRGCLSGALLFVLCLAGLWSGVSFTVRDIIAHFAVLRHESRTRATLSAAFAAKAIIATAASAVQGLLLTAALFWVFGARGTGSHEPWPGLLGRVTMMSPGHAFLVLWACHILGNAIGFVLSAWFRTAEAAIFMIPFVILPMVAFSGALVPPSQLPRSLVSVLSVSPLYQGYLGLLGSSANVCVVQPVDFERPYKTDRSDRCALTDRTSAPPEGSVGLTPFVQSEGACLHAVFLSASDFGQVNGYPRPPHAVNDDVASQLNGRLVVENLAALVGFSLLLNVLAFVACGRRMRTL